MRRIVFVLFFVGIVCAAVFAQQTPAKPQAIFKSGVEYVELDAVVTDKQDRPVKDLTRADFEIIEHGKSQTVSNLQFISIPPTRRTVADVKNTAPTIDVVSNVHSPLARQWVLVIDDLHIIEQHIVHTQKVVREFLEQLSPDDQVAIVFVGRSDLSQDFTNDLGAQMRTVNRIKDSLGFAYDAADQGGGASIKRIADADRHSYGIATIDVLNNISGALAKSTFSRKALVYVSEGMTYPGVDMNDRFQYTADFIQRLYESFDVARKAGVPIYTIDPRGAPDCSAVRGDCGEPPWSNIRNQWNHMNELALNTGGRAFVNNSDIVRAVRELVEDNNSFYLLGYYPDPLEHDGKFHDVEVKIRGRTDLKVRARAGYSAPKASKATEVEAKATLEGVLGAAFPVAGLQLRATAAPVAVGDKGMQTAVTLEVTYPQLPNEKFDDNLSFGMIALDHDGKVKASTRGSYKYRATPTNGVDVTFAINALIDLPPGPLTLRVGVASQSLDRAASIHIPVDVINPSRSVLQFGSVVLGFAGPPRQTSVPPGALKEIVPIQPTTTRTFSAKDALQIYAPLFWHADNDANALVTIAVRSGTTAVRQSRADVPGVPGTTPATQQLLKGTLSGTVPLSQLPAGAYVLELVARLPKGSVARKEIAFEIK